MYSLNLDYFDNITTEAQAYILGYFYSRGTGRLQFNIQDLPTLQLIQCEFGYTGPIHCRGQTCSLNITRQDFRDRLLAVGCRRTNRESSHIPTFSITLFAPFLRAIYENYGRSYYTKHTYVNISLTQNESLINDIRTFLKKELSITTHHLYRYEHLNSLTIFISKHEESVKFLNYIYCGMNPFYCQVRKYEKYRKIVENDV